MKIRTGFVSNSSSSSFVIAFPHKPESVEDLKEMMFGKQEWHYAGFYGEEDETDFPTQTIVETVFKDIGKEATPEEVYESIRNGWFDPYLIPEMFPGHYDSFEKTRGLTFEKDKDEMNRIWKEAESINNKRAKNIADAFRKGFKDQYIVVLSYSDNDGRLYTILEHSNVFYRLDHIRTSYH